MADWTRIGKRTVATWLSGGTRYAALVFSTASAIVWMNAEPLPLAGSVAVVGVLGVGWIGLVRMLRTGVYVDDDTVQVRGRLRTATVPWSEVAAIEAAPARSRGRQAGRDAVWLRLRSGRRIRTPLQRQERWWDGTLAGEDFDDAVKVLRRRLARVVAVHDRDPAPPSTRQPGRR